MKIEDAIKLYEFWAEDDRIDMRIRKEHKQMAHWLKELKADKLQGEWVPSESAEWISPIPDFYKCSICGKRVNLFQMHTYKFCPNCGAEMKVANENPLAGIEPKPIPTTKHTFVYQRETDDGK